jgi:hypothetical protein
MKGRTEQHKDYRVSSTSRRSGAATTYSEGCVSWGTVGRLARGCCRLGDAGVRSSRPGTQKNAPQAWHIVFSAACT